MTMINYQVSTEVFLKYLSLYNIIKYKLHWFTIWKQTKRETNYSEHRYMSRGCEEFECLTDCNWFLHILLNSITEKGCHVPSFDVTVLCWNWIQKIQKKNLKTLAECPWGCNADFKDHDHWFWLVSSSYIFPIVIQAGFALTLNLGIYIMFEGMWS